MNLRPFLAADMSAGAILLKRITIWVAFSWLPSFYLIGFIAVDVKLWMLSGWKYNFFFFLMYQFQIPNNDLNHMMAGTICIVAYKLVRQVNGFSTWMEDVPSHIHNVLLAYAN